MIDRVRVMETEKWRLVIPKATILLMMGYWSIVISSRLDKQDRPRKDTESPHYTTT